MQPDCTVIPKGATLYCMGIEVPTPRAGGFDFSSMDKYRYDPFSRSAAGPPGNLAKSLHLKATQAQTGSINGNSLLSSAALERTILGCKWSTWRCYRSLTVFSTTRGFSKIYSTAKIPCRWDKSYEGCRLEDMPYRRLTNPIRVFSFCFDSVSKARGRDNLLKLEIVRAGKLNAICFWFDLHLDEHCTLTAGILDAYRSERFSLLPNVLSAGVFCANCPSSWLSVSIA